MAIVETFGAAVAGEEDRGTAKPFLRARAVSAATRLWPFLSGCGRVANHRAIQALAGTPAETVWADVVGGRMLSPLSDHVGRAAFFTGDLDPKVSWIVDRVLRQGDIALDVGANLGLVSLRMAQRVGPAGRVHAFEPNPQVAALLRRTVARNGLRQVIAHQHGLGDTPGVLRLNVPADNMGSASVTAIADDEAVSSHDVEVRRLDAVIGRDRPVALMKVDVEGFEASVLRGAQGLLEVGDIDALIFEEHGRLDCGAPPETLAMMAAMPYDLYALPRSMIRMRLVPMSIAQRDGVRAHDYLAVARSPRGDALRRRLRLPPR